MRWFKKKSDTPRLLSLSPLRIDSMESNLISDHMGKAQSTPATTHRSRIDMSPSNWPRHIHSSRNRNDTNLYNVEESLIKVERKADRKRTKSQPRYTSSDQSHLRETRNPLMDRVKHTRLSCFKSPTIILNADGVPNSPPVPPNPLVQEPIQIRTLPDTMAYLSLEDSSLISKPGSPACLSSKLKAMSEKYLQASTNRFLAKLYKSSNPYHMKQISGSATVRRTTPHLVSGKVRSFSYGTLPGLLDIRKTRSCNPLYREDDTGLLDAEAIQLSYTDDLDELESRLQPRPDKEGEGDDSDSGILVSSESSCSSSSIRLREGDELYHLHNIDRGRHLVRAQSLDRREIFKNAPNMLLPVVNDLTIACEQSFVSVQIQKKFAHEDLGILMVPNGNLSQTVSRENYTVMHLVPGSLADKLGTVWVGDEIVHVNGERVKSIHVGIDKAMENAVRLRTRTLRVQIVLLRRCVTPPKVLQAAEDNTVEITITVETIEYDHTQTDATKLTHTSVPSQRHFTKKNSIHSSHSKISQHQSRRGLPLNQYQTESESEPEPMEPTDPDLNSKGITTEARAEAKLTVIKDKPSEAKKPTLAKSFEETCSGSQKAEDVVVRTPGRIVRRRLALFSPIDPRSVGSIASSMHEELKDLDVRPIPKRRISVNLCDVPGPSGVPPHESYFTVRPKSKRRISVNLCDVPGPSGVPPQLKWKYPMLSVASVASENLNTGATSSTEPSMNSLPRGPTGPTGPPAYAYVSRPAESWRCNNHSTIMYPCYRGTQLDSAPTNVSPSRVGMHTLTRSATRLPCTITSMEGHDSEDASASDEKPATAAMPTADSDTATSATSATSPAVVSLITVANCTEELTKTAAIAASKHENNDSANQPTMKKSNSIPASAAGAASLRGNGVATPQTAAVKECDATASTSNAEASSSSSHFCTLPRRPVQGPLCRYFTIELQRSPGRKQLGFRIVGGSDSPKGALGIFISSVVPGQQAHLDGRLKEGDEVLAINGRSCHNLSHVAALNIFKNIKSGPVVLQISRSANTINRNTNGTSSNDLTETDQ